MYQDFLYLGIDFTYLGLMKILPYKKEDGGVSVSYTHLTLPTIYSV